MYNFLSYSIQGTNSRRNRGNAFTLQRTMRSSNIGIAKRYTNMENKPLKEYYRRVETVGKYLKLPRIRVSYYKSNPKYGILPLYLR